MGEQVPWSKEQKLHENTYSVTEENVWAGLGVGGISRTQGWFTIESSD